MTCCSDQAIRKRRHSDDVEHGLHDPCDGGSPSPRNAVCAEHHVEPCCSSDRPEGADESNDEHAQIDADGTLEPMLAKE